MSIDHYRNIRFSAYIEYALLIAQLICRNFYLLRIFPHFMLIFFSPCGLCSRSLCTSLCGGEKVYFLVYKVIRNRSIWRPCQFLMLAPNALWKFYLSICPETCNNLYGRNLAKWRICMEHVKVFFKTIKNYMKKC